MIPNRFFSDLHSSKINRRRAMGSIAGGVTFSGGEAMQREMMDHVG